MAWNPETKTVLDSLTWGNTVACVAGTGIFGGAKRENSRTSARGEEMRGHLLSPSRVPLARPLKKINRCLLLRLQYRGSRVFNSIRATDNSHTLSEVTRSNLSYKARFGSYEAQKSYTLQQEWEKNARIFPSVPYN